jgi:hypothetical protein
MFKKQVTMKLIDKDALVAEIERLKADALQKKSQCKRSGLERMVHQISAYNKMLAFISTLEVKEVDLKKEYEKYYEQERYIQTFKLAKHFFELGLKAQKGE